jgi:hypothetical protein
MVKPKLLTFKKACSKTRVILSNAWAKHRPPTNHQSAPLNTWHITLVVVVVAAAAAAAVVDRPHRTAPAAMEAVEEEARQTTPLGAVVVVARVPSVLQAVLQVMQLRPLACHTSPHT